ncbi:MAG: macro domain-containing protein [Solobacterium sp.]|nr:macro domain-containing protein [Solobacterium sp.]
MPFQIIREDITRVKVDAIVNPTDDAYTHLGGTDMRVHDAAGDELYKECKRHGSLTVGDVCFTSSFNMNNCRYIIHTFGPIYVDGKHNEEELLIGCYENVLRCAVDNNIESIAIPLISTGSFRYPKKDALRVATNVITNFIYEHELDVYLLVYDKEAFDISNSLYRDIHNYLEDNGVYDEVRTYRLSKAFGFMSMPVGSSLSEHEVLDKEFSFVDFVEDESFNDCLRRLIREKNLIESDVYKRANLTKQAFNGIYNEGKVPKKNNVLALCIGLRLNIDEADDFIEKAGYSFSRGNKHDYIVRYFIENEIYDVYKINEILINEDLPYLGSKYD